MSFGEAVAGLARRVQVRTEAVVVAAVTETGARLIARSPVATGHFRGNWQLGVDTAPSGEVATGGTRESPAPPPKIPAVTPGARRYYWVNNVSYAGALETGEGGLRPLGLVALAEMEFPAIVATSAK